mmetsp:Transcript_10837/g.40615  ORF Transcript_10837/g.40615 Transcript_10837/m.40615 type:complete len:167 (-) Transcript_10837:74-574(-)
MLSRAARVAPRRWSRLLGSKIKKKGDKKSQDKGRGSSASKSIGREAQLLAQSGMQDAQSSFDKMAEKVLNAPPRKKVKYSEEERAEHHAIGRTYNIEMVRWHNKMNKAIHCRMKLKADAVRNLPEEVRLLAEQAPEATLPPAPLPIYHPSLIPFGREDAIKNRRIV